MATTKQQWRAKLTWKQGCWDRQYRVHASVCHDCKCRRSIECPFMDEKGNRLNTETWRKQNPRQPFLEGWGDHCYIYLDYPFLEKHYGTGRVMLDESQKTQSTTQLKSLRKTLMDALLMLEDN